MKISLFSQFGALNSGPVFAAIRRGLEHLGHRVVEHDMTADAAVIWSVLWAGRMTPNRTVYEYFQGSGRPVIVAEVGMIQRGLTWKLMRYDGQAHYVEPISSRVGRMGLRVSDWRIGDGCTSCGNSNPIVIATQRTESAQWTGMPCMTTWVTDTVEQLRAVTRRPILIRSHPRERMLTTIPHSTIDVPLRVHGTYDGYDFDRVLSRAHAVVNWSSSPAVVAVIAGVPVVCGPHSLAYDMSTPLTEIESPRRPDRTAWLERVAHTEWFTDELERGEPLAQLLDVGVF